MVLALLVVTAVHLSRTEASSEKLNLTIYKLNKDSTNPSENNLSIVKGRTKRSDSSSILSSIKDIVGQNIKRKFSQVAKSSASASGHFSHSYKKGNVYHNVPETYDHKAFDFWSLKKSILNTLLQAIKAIKGGVIAIKGQLIKGSGHIISAKGKLISSKGESITKLGKNIASSAILIPHSSHTHTGYGHHMEYYDHPEYSASPSSPNIEYDFANQQYGDADTGKHHQDSGILILKKVPPSHQYENIDFDPAEATKPSYGKILGKFFAASSSLDPHAPIGFQDYETSETLNHEVIDSTYYKEHDDGIVINKATTPTFLYKMGNSHIFNDQTGSASNTHKTNTLSVPQKYIRGHASNKEKPELAGNNTLASFFLPTVLNYRPTASTNLLSKINYNNIANTENMVPFNVDNKWISSLIQPN